MDLDETPVGKGFTEEFTYTGVDLEDSLRGRSLVTTMLEGIVEDGGKTYSEIENSILEAGTISYPRGIVLMGPRDIVYLKREMCGRG